jgi:hypothetical protein
LSRDKNAKIGAERCGPFHLVVQQGAASGRMRATMHPTIYDDQTCRRACGGSGYTQLDRACPSAGYAPVVRTIDAFK